MDVRSLLFVCAGNICRSPIAEAVFRDLSRGRPSISCIDVGSAGTVAIDGNRATADAIRSAREELGLDISGHRARNVYGLEADLILTMDGLVAREMARLNPSARVVLLGEYAADGEIVEDPYGCPLDVYRTCARQIRVLVEAAAARLERQAC